MHNTVPIRCSALPLFYLFILIYRSTLEVSIVMPVWFYCRLGFRERYSEVLLRKQKYTDDDSEWYISL